MINLQKLIDDIGEWSDATFGSGTSRIEPMLEHLELELAELKAEVNYHQHALREGLVDHAKHIKMRLELEFGDCFMMLVDAARISGIDAEGIEKLTRRKLEINKRRKWLPPDAKGIIRHKK